MSYRINRAELRRVIAEKLQEGDEVAERIRNGIVRRQPSDTGRTRAAWKVTRRVTDGGTRMEWAIENPVQSNGFYVWALLHSGTGIYGPSGRPIEPVSASVLRFRLRGGAGPSVAGRRRSSSGGWVFAKQVRGMPSSNYITETLEVDAPDGWRVTINSRPGTAVS